MNEPDPIVDEVRRIRQAHAARFNYDLKAIFRDIKEKEKRSGLTFVSFSRQEEVATPSTTAVIVPDAASLPTAPR